MLRKHSSSPKRILFALLCGALSNVIPGCAILQGEARTKVVPLRLAGESDDQTLGQVVSFPAQFRAAFIIRRAGKEFLCAEPPPDVAQSIAASLAASLKAPKDQASAEASASRVATAMELSGRTELTLLAREMLYRNCEMAVNYAGDPPEKVLEHQGKIVEAIVKLADAELKKATADQERARAELLALTGPKARQVEFIMLQLFDGEKIDTDKLTKLRDGLPGGDAKNFLDSISESTSREAFAADLKTETFEVVTALAQALEALNVQPD